MQNMLNFKTNFTATALNFVKAADRIAVPNAAR